MKFLIAILVLTNSLAAFAQKSKCFKLDKPLQSIQLEAPSLVSQYDLPNFQRIFPQNKIVLDTGAVRVCLEDHYATYLVFYNAKGAPVAAFDGMIRGSMQSDVDFNFIAQNFSGFHFVYGGKYLHTEKVFKNPYDGINLAKDVFEVKMIRNNVFSIRNIK